MTKSARPAVTPKVTITAPPAQVLLQIKDDVLPRLASLTGRTVSFSTLVEAQLILLLKAKDHLEAKPGDNLTDILARAIIADWKTPR